MAHIGQITIKANGYTSRFDSMITEIYERLIEFIDHNEGVAHFDGIWELNPISGEIDDPDNIYWELSYSTSVSLIDRYGEEEE